VRVLLVPNIANPAATSAACELATWLGAQGVNPILVTGDAQAAGLPDFGVPASEIGEPLLAVALGGDGTILKTVHLLGEAEVPLLGVNLGRLGFLSGAQPGSMREAITDALSGDVAVERRATLSAEAFMGGRPVGRYRALNEVVVGRSATGRVLRFEVLVNDRQVARFSADGVIAATATGSTAYALSAGGPVVSPSIGGTLVVPVAAHTLRTRPLLVGPSDVVEIALTDPARSPANLTVDGDPVPCRLDLERLVVSRGGADVLLVKHDGRDFYDVVAEEFFGR